MCPYTLERIGDRRDERVGGMLSQPVCKADSEVSRMKSHADGIPLFAIKGAVKAEGEISVCAPRAVYLELGSHV